MMRLRPYQQQAIDNLRASGNRRLLLSAPTGSGKTVIAAAIVASANALGSRVLFIAHRLELIDQTVNQFRGAGVPHIGVMRADDERTDVTAPVQIATIQTLARREMPAADLVIVDECHRVMGDSYQRVVSNYPDAIIIGLTATPCRLDGRALGDTFEKLIQVASYSELIALGNIVAPVVYSTRSVISLDAVHTRQGDYAIDELEQVMIDPHVIGNVVEEYKRHAEDRHTVVFACTIKHSQMLVAEFVRVGIAAEHLDGDTPHSDRRAILARLDSGETAVVCNVGVLCEGWDQPGVKCISIARPTKSLSLWMQMAGRSLRPWNDVTPVIIDHGKNVDRHGFPHDDQVWDLLQGTKPKPKITHRTCPSCFAYCLKNPCEYCGFETPRQEREIRIDKSAVLEVRAGDPNVMFFDRCVEQAKTKGFKPGYASAKYKEKFGQWPPWSWSQRIKTEFANDSAWQARLLSRENEREHWKQVNERTIELPADESFRIDDL